MVKDITPDVMMLPAGLSHSIVARGNEATRHSSVVSLVSMTVVMFCAAVRMGATTIGKEQSTRCKDDVKHNGIERE